MPRREATPQEILMNQDLIDPRFESFLQEMMLDEHFTGVALVMREGKIVHANGYGNATEEKENTVTTAFHVASITKQFTAAAVLQLVENGAVDLDVSVNECLPQRYRSPKWDSVTIHHLLSHTSESSGHDYPDWLKDKGFNLAEVGRKRLSP